MNVLLPQLGEGDWKSHLEALIAQPTLGPFEPGILDFIQQVSRSILLDRALRQYPELMAMAHWMRRANIEEIRKLTTWNKAGSIRLPRGTVLHFAPSNVDTIFVYSWFLSILAGNANIVRLSTRRGAQIEVLLRVLKETLSEPKFRSVRDRTLILSYDHDPDVSEKLSRHCEVRVIWGGDETIRQIRAIPLNPLATELVFPDRFSSAAIHASSVVDAGEKEFAGLVRHFYNDAFWFDQMACSSPRLVMWIGAPAAIVAAQKRFWEGVEARLVETSYGQPAAVRMRRLTAAYFCACEIEDVHLLEPSSGLFTRVELPEISSRSREAHCGGGLFFEMKLARFCDIAEVLGPKDQTLSVYGFTQPDLARLAANLPKRSVDRIVPIGQALTFYHVWDGNNLLHAFSREVTLAE
jgi:hypothetical protein